MTNLPSPAALLQQETDAATALAAKMQATGIDTHLLEYYTPGLALMGSVKVTALNLAALILNLIDEGQRELTEIAAAPRHLLLLAWKQRLEAGGYWCEVVRSKQGEYQLVLTAVRDLVTGAPIEMNITIPTPVTEQPPVADAEALKRLRLVALNLTVSQAQASHLQVPLSLSSSNIAFWYQMLCYWMLHLDKCDKTEWWVRYTFMGEDLPFYEERGLGFTEQGKAHLDAICNTFKQWGFSADAYDLEDKFRLYVEWHGSDATAMFQIVGAQMLATLRELVEV